MVHFAFWYVDNGYHSQKKNKQTITLQAVKEELNKMDAIELAGKLYSCARVIFH